MNMRMPAMMAMIDGSTSGNMLFALSVTLSSKGK